MVATTSGVPEASAEGVAGVRELTTTSRHCSSIIRQPEPCMHIDPTRPLCSRWSKFCGSRRSSTRCTSSFGSTGMQIGMMVQRIGSLPGIWSGPVLSWGMSARLAMTTLGLGH